MRNIITVGILVLAFAFFGTVSDIYLKKSTDKMIEDIENIKTVDDVRNLTDEWDKYSQFAELIIDHGEIDLLNQNLWAMEVEIENDTDEFERSRKLAKEMFNHIKERNTFGWNNVF